MQIDKLEIQVFAPELNKIHLKNGVILNAAGCATIKAARNKLFPKPLKAGLYCIVDSVYSDPQYKSLNRYHIAGGQIDNRLQAIRYAKKHLQQDGGVLLNGDTLPPNKLVYKFKYY